MKDIIQIAEEIKYEVISWYLDEGDYQPTEEEATLKIKKIIQEEIQNSRQELIEEIENMIVDEILTAQMEGQPTSRLTSLSTRINKQSKL